MNLTEFHKTTTNELLAITNRVKNLILHWPEVGRHKEAVLKNVIKRFIPDKYSIGTGFVIKQTHNRGEHLSSRQIDLIIYDDTSPILFKEGDFIILTADAVRGIIEVKANLQNQDLTNVVRQANENGLFIYSGKENKNQVLFNGIFSFEGYENNFDELRFADKFIEGNIGVASEEKYKKFKVNHMSLNKDWFLKFWPEDERPHSLYNIEDLSFPFFISNLTDTLANKSVRKNNFIWYPTNKELNLKHQF